MTRMLLKRSLALSGAALILGFVAGFTVDHDDTRAAPRVDSDAAQTDSASEATRIEGDDLTAAVGASTVEPVGDRTPESQVAALSPSPKPKTVEDPATTASLPVPPKPVSKSVTVKSGDTLGKILGRNGVSGADAHKAVVALRDVFDPRDLKVGQDLTLTFHSTSDSGSGTSAERFAGLSLEPDFKTIVRVSRSSDDIFGAEAEEKALTPRWTTASGVIERSLYLDALKEGVPMAVLIEMIRAYSWDVDFQRSLQPGDRFEVMFEELTDADGRVLSSGAIGYAALTLGDSPLKIYRHTLADGTTDYFNEKGEAAKKGLMRTPIDGARLSSGFGSRKHPILGYTKMHKGADFAAPTGTPIYAAGDGRIDYAGRNGGYGKYIRIRHNGRYSTAYAHLSRIHVKPAQHVRQGDVIGRVGSTGRSTGPHLHYEILVDGRQQNPMRVKMPSGRKLTGDDLQDFMATVRTVDATYAAVRGRGVSVAAATAN